MKEEKLRELLEKYFNGDTSLEEEKALREYFSGDEILPGYDTEREIFNGYSSASEAIPPASEDLESRILSSIDDYEKENHRKRFTRQYMAISGIAATLLILVGSYFFFIRKAEPADTFSDPVIAYAETMKILNEVSLKLNKGTSALHTIGKINSVTRQSLESIDRSASILSGSIEKIRLIDRLSDTDTQSKKTNNK
jgi:hypothetical protein